MIDAMFTGLSSILVWPTVGWLLLGTFIGLVVGVLPGLGSVFSITVFLPIALALDPIDGLTFIVALFTVGQISAEVTAILFAVPGEPSAAATILDGYPLTQQGKGGLALGVNLTSNLVGGLLGAAILLVSIPIARPVVLSLGTPELFMCILVGLAFVATLAGTRPLLGYLMATLGLLLSMVGTSVIGGIPRYTFGMVDLWAGLPVVSFALGFFAVPELYSMYAKDISTAGASAEAVRFRPSEAIRETFKYWKTLVASSGVGVFIGAVPGLGGVVAQWVSYALAQRMSKHPERFGKGAVDGVVGPSAACNAKDGGQLIPTLFFGVPGGLSMALLLLAMLSMDVTPGPRMVTDYLDITFAIVWIVIITHVIGVAITALSIKGIVRVASLRRHILFPILVSLVLVAAYATTRNMMGIWVLIAASAMGVFMKERGWPRPPFILAFVLAPLAERYLFLSMQNYGLGMFSRPGVILLSSLLVVMMAWVVRGQRRLVGAPG